MEEAQDAEMEDISGKSSEIDFVDLSNKGLENLPDELFDMKHLESVNLGVGNSIPVSERYKLLDAVPTIKRIDNKDVTNIRKAIENLVEIFVRRLQELFLTKRASDIYSEEVAEEVRVTKMVVFAQKTITDGPEALKEFKNYKLEKLIRDNYDVYVSNALEASLKAKGKENDIPATTKKSRKGGKAKSKNKAAVNSSHTNSKPLKLTYLLQTHSKDNSPKDLQTKVWMCEFEPDVLNPGKTTNLVATCGGDSVCFIDCTNGRVLKKYKEINEEFYCMSWTVIKYRNELTGIDKIVSMLAVAGVSGDIKLIHPEDLICFQRISHHKKPVDALLFHPVIPNYMFSGSEDKTIVLWDLGYPFSTEIREAKKLMTLRAGTSGTVRQIAICPHGKILIAACDDGLYAWTIEVDNETARTPTYKFTFSKNKVKPLDSANCITNNLLAVKRIEEGVINIFHSASEFMVDDGTVIYNLSWRKTETPFLKFNFSVGSNVLLAGDDEGTVWMYDLSELVNASKSKKSVIGFSLPPAEKLRCFNVYGKVFNHVTISSDGRHVVGVTENNVVAIWKMT